MTSAAEQMAANMSWSAFGKATELRQRIVFALILLIVYRIGTYIPVPGIDNLALKQFFEEAGQGIGGILNMFTGGGDKPYGDICPRYNALYISFNYCPINDGYGATIRTIKKRRAARSEKDKPIYSIWNSLVGIVPSIWFSGEPRGG